MDKAENEDRLVKLAQMSIDDPERIRQCALSIKSIHNILLDLDGIQLEYDLRMLEIYGLSIDTDGHMI